MFTILPAFRFAISRATACIQKNTPLALIACMRSQSASVTSKKPRLLVTPALFTRTSMRPNVPTVRATIASMSAILAMSVLTNRPRRSCASTSAAVRRPVSSSISAPTTWAPSAANRTAMALPMPAPLPVTIAILSSSRMSCPCWALPEDQPRLFPDSHTASLRSETLRSSQGSSPLSLSKRAREHLQVTSFLPSRRPPQSQRPYACRNSGITSWANSSRPARARRGSRAPA